MRYLTVITLILSAAVLSTTTKFASAAPLAENSEKSTIDPGEIDSDPNAEDSATSDQSNPILESQAEGDEADKVLSTVSYDLEALPFPTRRMHELILEATKAGDLEKLRALIGVGDTATQLSFGGFDGDPIEFLKSQSGDDEGFEIMAILEEILEAGYVHMDQGTEHEIFVWPYFFGVPLEKLTPKEKVELFRIVTYGDFVDFKDFGGYIFYRVGISPTGRWQFFVAGD